MLYIMALLLPVVHLEDYTLGGIGILRGPYYIIGDLRCCSNGGHIYIYMDMYIWISCWHQIALPSRSLHLHGYDTTGYTLYCITDYL